ncbi:TonB-dependent receptor [Pontimicrobium sp. SW4]|uniref:TonB-dependent receptor n=1 Tax=Pontimicrobium sp. SW4 TaxID=3153519 RepID=A0AAU7BUN7_9FLAO
MALDAASQNTVSLNYDSVSLEEIINQVESQTKFKFIFNNDEINIQQKFSIRSSKEKVVSVLNRLLQTTNITYVIKDKFIVLSRKDIRKKFTISGNVTDAVTGESLINANIIVKNQSRGVNTNSYGFYSLTLEEGDYILQISYLGYTYKEIDISLSNNITLNIELEPTSSQLDEIVITNNSNSKVSTVISGVSDLKVSEIKRIPAFLGEPDIVRALLTLPGISTVGEGASGINVRGGNIDQNLMLLDEAPIYNPTHVFGLFSSLNADALSELKIYKGGIPARYGGRASSVIDIKQREGNSKELKGEGGIGLLFSRLTLEGPIKKDKLSFLVSGRRSYFDIFFPIIGGELKGQKLSFYDLSTKLSWNINDKNKVYLSGYFGKDVLKFGIDEDDSETGEKSTETTDVKWNNATATLRWNHIFSNKLFMNLSAVYGRYNYNLESSDGGPLDSFYSIKWRSSIDNILLKPDFTYYINPNVKMRFGANTTLYKFIPAKITSEDEGINTVNIEAERGLELAPYIEYEMKKNRFSLNAGLRYSWFGNFGANSVYSYNPNFPKNPNSVINTKMYDKGELIKSYEGFEPRISLKYNLKDNAAIKLGYNKMFQYIHYLSNTTASFPFDVWKISGEHIKPLEVHQISAGYAYDTPNNDYNFNVEGYYKTFKNIIEYKNGADLFINKYVETQLLPAEGYSYGAEFSVYKNIGKLKGNANYTYSVTRRKTNSEFLTENINDGNYYPSNYDRPHVLNVTTNYSLNKKWNMDVFFTYQTGRPTTEATGRLIFDGSPYLTYSDRNAYRLPDTHRMDVSFTYTPTPKLDKKWRGSWSFGVYNVYARKNAFTSFSIFRNNKLKNYNFYLIGAPVPFITYNFKF